MSHQTWRQKLAANTPPFLRKAVRMAEHYARRHKAWVDIFRHMSGERFSDKLLLGASALACPITALARLDGFQSPVLLGDARVNVKGVGRFHARRGTDDIIHVQTSREPLIRSTIERLLSPGDVFVDAGANIGFFTVIAARAVGANGNVHAIEMMPPTADRLKAHIAANGLSNVSVIERALSDSDGGIVTATAAPDKWGQASIIASGDESARTVRYDVPCARLDTLLSSIGQIALIKMDLEGAEYQALIGAEALLPRVAAIAFENNSEDRRIFELLEKHGFSIAPLDGHDYLAQRI